MGKTVSFFRFLTVIGLATIVMGWTWFFIPQIPRIISNKNPAERVFQQWTYQKKARMPVVQTLLNERYSTHLEKSLTDLLQQITGDNSVKVVVNALLKNKESEVTTTMPQGVISQQTQQQEILWQSVGVLIDGYWTKGKGKADGYRSRSEEEMHLYQQLIQGAIGFNAKRGDKVVLLNLPFAPQKTTWFEKNKILLVQTSVLILGLFLSFILLLNVILSEKYFLKNVGYSKDHFYKKTHQNKFRQAQTFLTHLHQDQGKKEKVFFSQKQNFDDFSKEPFVKRSIWNQLEEMPVEQIVAYLQKEYPQTIAVVLYHFSDEKAAAVLSQLPSYLMWDVLLRLASLEKLTPHALKSIEQALKETFNAEKKDKKENKAQEKLACILMQMTPSDREKILKMFSEKSPDLEKHLSKKIMRFEDLALWEEHQLKKLIRKISQQDLVFALKGSSEKVKNAFAKNMPIQIWLDLIQQLLKLEDVSLEKIDQAQQRILTQAQHLE